ncbi:E3 ubiquitin-protein ligase UBR2 isoform X1 [Diorhabda carinulata]|uniref:E3 ubiquitin-protein ligase UBR2 isoform X1 n=1 Tax=Diorhabda carinulata TaxID=1163345 RepID=UPI0025A29389|nr:E3 ubiquitin-protein ligase UBR2 isoform X1 [Diorhabda carinulata]XP_057659802.1 E3 ubiquitin-protein ligase UBR2 isoform X1 [Diorhabda carinulata]
MDEAADIVMSTDNVSFESVPVENSARIKELVTDIVQNWREKHNDGLLGPVHFEELWRLWVPRIYSPSLNESCLNWNFNEELSQEILFNTLDKFICNGDPNTVFAHMDSFGTRPSVCGRVFKLGEPTYSCRECGMDSTCVLCVECFKNSEHRHHKYKMGTSRGGGCCDCGDREAWKKDPFCTIHMAGLTTEEQNKSLPEDLKERTRLVFETVLWYAYRLLSTEQVSDIRLGAGSSENFFDIDTYCTILYNDEIHTFEHVINTLTKVLKCNQRSSTEFVTNIDREGRAIVKCSSFQHCSDLKQDIEKYTSRHGNKPLKVLVNHSHIIAHQIFAGKLLSWLERFLGQGEAFRAIFAEVVLKPKSMEPCIVKGILQKDLSLWKSARTQWHRLLISGMLLEYENKKALAKIFTKNYGQVMKDFIKDDHDHTYSISSLSVQLFTVPTLAHHLIAHDDVLYILLNTLISECNRKCNKAGKLEFERNPTCQTFKRALYMLYDLRYLLGSIPETWTDDLRRSFLHGLSMMLSLLTMMQGMDAVTRQVGQHMEYEPEWESGFNLHIKLAYCISLAVEWCGTDKIVLVKAYRSVLKKLEENPCYEPSEAGKTRELADHSTACLHYDVSTKPVSIHLPLTRFLAALHLHLEKFNLHFDGPEFQVPKPTPIQIIEPVLRAQVMIAQVHSGMWRRNGYALLNTLFFYHNVKCRTEMLDRDITLLQIGASLIESNEFLIHVLNKFNLIGWAMSDYEINSLKSPEEDSVRQTINLVEEMLHLLIFLIGERYMPGVSNVTVEDRIRKEIIQYLCIKPLPHSELVKTIPDDLTYREVAVDEVIQELANFKKPVHGSGKGVYELKEEYYDDFNVFFYHYTREELSKSEEAQRKRRKAKGDLECCPPPKLPKLNESFSLLVNLLQCDVMLHIMSLVLERCINLRARSFSEQQLHKTLHLIGYALLEEESKAYPFFKFIENSHKFRIFPLMEELLNSPRVDSHKGLLQWTLNKFKQLSDKKEVNPEINAEASTSEKVDNEKERRANLAAERRAKLMAQMQTMQKNFIKNNASLFEETSTDVRKPRTSSQIEVMDITEPTEEQPIALGPKQSLRFSEEKTYTCILCQEEEKITATGRTMVLAAFVQQATVLCQQKNNELLMDISKHDPLYLHANLGPAPHTSTCGHVMHSDCWRKYFDIIMVREHRRPYRLRHPASFDVDKQEFLCPLCECLSNTVLPLIPPLSILQPTQPVNYISFDNWLLGISHVLNNKQKTCHGIFKCDASDECKNKHCSACIYATNGTNIEQHDNAECEVNCTLQPHQVFCSYEFTPDVPDEFKQLFPIQYPELETNHKEMIQVFAQVAYTRGLNVNPHPMDKRLVPMCWKTLGYTIHSIEVMLRDAQKPLLGHLSSRQRDCIESLVRIVGVLGCTWQRSVFINIHAVNLLTIFFENGNDVSSLLQWDSLGFLISLTFSLPSLSCKNNSTPVPTGGTLDWYILRIIFISHIVKILILMKDDDLDTSMDTDTNEDATIEELLRIIGKKTEGVSTNEVWKHVQYACLPFLRCCVLFYHYLTDVKAPVNLTEQDGDTFSNMCEYLDLPQTPKELFNSTNVMDLVKRWCSHEEVVSCLAQTPLQVIREPLQVPRLINLPNDYSELINTVSMFTCPNMDEDSKNPCMCLVCGEILCSQSYCCQTELNKTPVGACNYHANKCGAGIGIFLRVRECEILFLAAPHRGCLVSPPYLDDYGETDQGLRRGNPLRLCRERYKKLQTSWLGHSIHEEIARSIETSNHIISIQWNLL